VYIALKYCIIKFEELGYYMRIWWSTEIWWWI